MKDRIKEFRKCLGLTQTEFANQIGISRSAVTKLESGENVPSDQSIKLMCTYWGLNEEWVRTGNGRMFLPKDRHAEIGKLVADLSTRHDDDFRVRLVNILARLPDDKWNLLEEIAEDLAKKHN